MKVTVKELRSFLSDPNIPDEAIVEIGFERYDGCDDGTDIGYDYSLDAELLVATRYDITATKKRKAQTIYKLEIWATNYPEIRGKIIKRTP